MKSICFVATSPFAVNSFLLGHLHMLAEHFKVTLCVNSKAYQLSPDIDDRVSVIHIPILRKISLLQDCFAVIQLIAIFRKSHFEVVHSITPKGGLLAMMAAFFCQVPNRIHTFTGQVWVTRSGLMRVFLKCIDRLIVCFSTKIFSDSESQSRFLERELGLPVRSIEVLGAGSISGVDVSRFCPDEKRRKSVRENLKTGKNAFVFLFVGRITRDKGVFDLICAFRNLSRSRGGDLWMVGPDEEKLIPELKLLAGDAAASIRWIGPTTEPECFMAAADLLVLPSYREGFGLVVVEAAGCGLPTLAYEINGIVDAISNGITGALVQSGNIDALTLQMEFMVGHRAVVKKLGGFARKRVVGNFSSIAISKAWLNYYKQFS